MSDKQASTEHDPAGGLPIEIEPGATDLGDDAERDAANRGSTIEPGSRSDTDPGSGLAVSIEPGATDLGDDANQTVGNRDSLIEEASSHSGTDPNSGLPIDPGASS